MAQIWSHPSDTGKKRNKSKIKAEIQVHTEIILFQLENQHA